MYDRYAIFSPLEALEEHFEAKMNAPFHANYNASPSQALPIITNELPKIIQQIYWGLPSKMANEKALSVRLFNLPLENAQAKPIYRSLMEKQRCLILANGFYLWKQVSKRQRVPYFCYFQKFDLMAFAGIWEHYDDIEGNQSFVFNMLTTEAKGTTAAYQSDIPLILDQESQKKWLEPRLGQDDIMEITSKSTKQMISLHAVKPMVNDPKNNEKSMIEPAPPADQFGNYTLFS